MSCEGEFNLFNENFEVYLKISRIYLSCEFYGAVNEEMGYRSIRASCYFGSGEFVFTQMR
jgi:hypothetical protein